VLDLPTKIGDEFVRAFDVRLVKQTTASWEFWFGLLEKFVAREGHALVPQGYSVDGCRLGSWVNKQRRDWVVGTLAPERQRRLDEFEGWIWDVRQAAWEEGFAVLKRLVRQEGHARVPRGLVEDGFNLGAWAHKQRAAWKAGKLDPERQRRLGEVGGWVWDTVATQWEEGFAHLMRFVKREGHALVPQTHIEDGFKLGSWVTRQRTSYKRGKEYPERQRRLDELEGWVWDTLATRWEEGFAHLMRFVKREGHALVPTGHLQDGFRLGQWVGVQRTVYSKGGLDPKRQRRLEALKGWAWDRLTAQWEEGFAHLVQFVDREGHALVPSDHIEDEFRLGGWVVRQRTARKAGRLEKERQRRLDELSGWAWDRLTAQWEEGFATLKRFVQREGHAIVAVGHVEGQFRLGGWVRKQRMAWKSGKVQPERQRRLDELPGWVWDPHAVQWDRGFDKLRRFVAREGHARVPATHSENGFKLGQWVQVQRQAYVRNKLVPTRTEQLEELPGWAWDATGRKASPNRPRPR